MVFPLINSTRLSYGLLTVPTLCTLLLHSQCSPTVRQRAETSAAALSDDCRGRWVSRHAVVAVFLFRVLLLCNSLRPYLLELAFSMFVCILCHYNETDRGLVYVLIEYRY